jgi:uncharacterized protein YcaQ
VAPIATRYGEPVRSISQRQARALALGAQGLLDPENTTAPRDRRHLRRAMGHLGVLQIDAVNAVARSHHLVLRARLGAHDESLLHRSAFKHRELFEYWGHEACFIPIEDHRLYRWRMQRALNGEVWKGIRKFAAERSHYLGTVLTELDERGPLSAGQFSEGSERRGTWWGWSDSKLALEWLFWIGEVTTHHREGFTRVYDRTERVIPSPILDEPTPTEADAQRTLLERAAGHLGIATTSDLADYHRLKMGPARDRVRELVEAGTLEEVSVAGWHEPGYITAGATMPRRRSRSVLLSPFDPVVWCRPRAERIFDFEYRLEIYTPKAKRRYGYYVLPFLHDNALRARLDVRADRAAGVLTVPGAYEEPDAMQDEALDHLAVELRRLAQWLGLPRVEIGDRGTLSTRLAKVMG